MRRARAALAACLLGLTMAAGATDGIDGRWLLQIAGHNSYLFGEPGLGGGLRMPWEVEILFEIRDGEYRVGSGSARWLGEVVGISRPPGWFRCRQVEGTYLDSNLVTHATPRVRFAAFPVAGEVRERRIVLRPGYEPPGNYLAVTYECETNNGLAYDWFALAERGKQILGKRQDAERKTDEARQQVRVREVVSLPPEASVELPLEDGWSFVVGGDDEDGRAAYRLERAE